MSMSRTRLIQLGLVSTLVGLAFALICAITVTPATFVLFAAVGVPLMGVGLLAYVVAIWKDVRMLGLSREAPAGEDE